MSVENIVSYVKEKGELVKIADSYLYSLEGWHDRGHFNVDRKSDDSYIIATRIDDVQCVVEVTTYEAYRLAGKCSSKEELENKIDKYIEKKIYKKFLSLIAKDNK